MTYWIEYTSFNSSEPIAPHIMTGDIAADGKTATPSGGGTPRTVYNHFETIEAARAAARGHCLTYARKYQQLARRFA